VEIQGYFYFELVAFLYCTKLFIPLKLIGDFLKMFVELSGHGNKILTEKTTHSK
jgi:hypothetical protein